MLSCIRKKEKCPKIRILGHCFKAQLKIYSSTVINYLELINNERLCELETRHNNQDEIPVQ